MALILKETMEDAGRAMLKTFPVEAEVAIVGSWAEKWDVEERLEKNERYRL